MAPRRPMARAAARRPRAQFGFTLIELLVVIAIIAILAAIIFPVGATVRENARKTQSISNMKTIFQAVAQYELDNRKYPEYLFGPAIKAGSTNGCAVDAQGRPVLAAAGDTACTMQQAASLGSKLGGLYPEYVKDLTVFGCPNNSVATTVNQATTRAVQRYEMDRTVTPPASALGTRVFYAYDSYDASPKITGTNTVDKNTFVARYSKMWTPVVADTSTLTADQQRYYKNQLNWRSPSADTYLTMTSHHVPSSNQVIVLWLNGTAKALDLKKLSNNAKFAGTAPNDFDTYKLLPTD